MKKIYRCLIGDCDQEFDTLEEMTYRLEHFDDLHVQMVEQLGLHNCYSEETVEEETTHSKEDLQGREFTDFPPNYRIQTPQDPMKPLYEYPKYGDARIEGYYEYPYSPYFYSKKDNAFICTHPHFGTHDFKEFLKHMYTEHKVDFEDFLKHHVKMSIINRIRFEKGSNQHLSEESLEKMVDSEIKELLITAELKAKPTESLTGYLSTKFDNLKSFLTGESQIHILELLSASIYRRAPNPPQ